MTYDVYASLNRRSVENPDSQLKMTGYFEPQGKHPNAIHFMLVKLNCSESKVRALGL